MPHPTKRDRVKLTKIKDLADKLATGLVGTATTEISNPDDLASQVTRIDGWRTTVHASVDEALAATDEPGFANGRQSALEALSQLKGLGRSGEIPRLDRAASSLAGITTLLTGLFIGLGFATGDFVKMYRNFFAQSFVFLILAIVALLLGTFAFVINGNASNTNLWAERVAIYVGIACSGGAFIVAAWGLAQGASGATTQPTISAALDTGANPPALTVSVDSSAVPRSQHIAVTIWGHDRGNNWIILRHDDIGPNQAGDISDSVKIINQVATYSDFSIVAALESGTGSGPTAPPPASCTIAGGGRAASGVTSRTSCVAIREAAPAGTANATRPTP